MPKRIQLQRRKGWRKPEGSIVVARPSRWGNPYPVAEYGLALSLDLYHNTLRGYWSPMLVQSLSDEQVRKAYQAHYKFRYRIGGDPMYLVSDLAGKDLCCWCPLDQRCHADELLRLANARD